MLESRDQRDPDHRQCARDDDREREAEPGADTPEGRHV
jgi:hypothetical protein